jgi:negative regulator of replication initiation
MRDTISGALQATAYILETCKKAKSTREIKRKVEAFRDWLLSETAKDVQSAMPRNPK